MLTRKPTDAFFLLLFFFFLSRLSLEVLLLDAAHVYEAAYSRRFRLGFLAAGVKVW
jgi:hypothetical protein